MKYESTKVFAIFYLPIGVCLMTSAAFNLFEFYYKARDPKEDLGNIPYVSSKDAPEKRNKIDAAFTTDMIEDLFPNGRIDEISIDKFIITTLLRQSTLSYMRDVEPIQQVRPIPMCGICGQFSV